MGWLQDIRVVSIVGGQSIEEQGFKLRQVGSPCHLFRIEYLLFDFSVILTERKSTRLFTCWNLLSVKSEAYVSSSWSLHVLNRFTFNVLPHSRHFNS